MSNVTVSGIHGGTVSQRLPKGCPREEFGEHRLRVSRFGQRACIRNPASWLSSCVSWAGYSASLSSEFSHVKQRQRYHCIHRFEASSQPKWLKQHLAPANVRHCCFYHPEGGAPTWSLSVLGSRHGRMCWLDPLTWSPRSSGLSSEMQSLDPWLIQGSLPGMLRSRGLRATALKGHRPPSDLPCCLSRFSQRRLREGRPGTAQFCRFRPGSGP